MLLLLLSLLACVDQEHSEGTEAGCDTVGDLPDNGAVQAIGDSMFDFVGGCQDAPDFASVALGERVENNAVGGATMLEDIPDQYQPGGCSTYISAAMASRPVPPAKYVVP